MLSNLFEGRALSFQSVFASGDNFEMKATAGTIVNQDSVFTINAVFSAISLISQTISTLPVDAFVRVGGDRRPLRPAPEWIQKPDVDTTKAAFYGSVIVSMLLEGNAFIRVYSNDQGQIVNMNVLNPQNVKVKRNGIGRVMFEVRGEERLLSSEEVVFIPDVVKPGHIRGTSRIDALKTNFSLAQALESYSASFFGSGTHTSGILEFPGNLTQDQAKNLVENFDARHRSWQKAHKTAVLTGGAKYTPTTTNPQESQLLDARKHAVADVARIFNIPPHLLGLDKGMSYNSVESNNLAWVTHCLRPIISKLEDGFSPLLSRFNSDAQAFLSWNLNGLLRADIETRTKAYSSGLQAGYLTINDVRRQENLNSIDDPSADTPRVPLANVNIENATLSSETQKVKMARDLVMVGYDPQAVLEAIGLPSMEHTGLPSVQLQGVQNINPEDPGAVYPEGEEE